jgi:hypoxanthine phosphoribosyltransferase
MARKKAKKARTGSRRSGRELGDYLRALRRARGLSLSQVAASTGEEGLKRSYLSQIETGRIKRPRPDTLALLVTAYQADYTELLRRAGYGGFEAGVGRGRGLDGSGELDWLPHGVRQLDPDDRRTVSEYIEYLLWRRGAREPDDEDGHGRWISWREVQEWARETRAALARARFDPDMVIGLGRGGAILGGMIAGALGLKPVTVLDMVHRPDEEEGEEERHIEGALELTGYEGTFKALLVQGEVRSGRSLLAAQEFVEGKVREKRKLSLELRTIALVVYPEVPVEERPDHYLKLAKLDPPWRGIPGYQRSLRDDDGGG